MLTESFLRGWLTFDHKTLLSPLREDFILSFLEQRLLLDVAKAKLDVVSSIVSGAPSRQNVTALSNDLKQYSELALPYLAKKDNIVSSKTKQELNNPSFWREVLAKKRKDIVSGIPDESVEFTPVEPETIN